MNSKVIIWLVVIGVIFVGGFFLLSDNTDSKIIGEDGEVLDAEFSWSQIGAWGDIELEDISTGEKFTINGFAGKPVLLESFAVWCPTCTKQQNKIKDYHEEVGDSVISISLDTDASEDEERIRNHIEKNGFDWYYSVSPIELTQDLIGEYGPGIVNAPSVPVILICEDGRARKLGNGVKNVNDLKQAVASC
jgi:thiol-disulfide isomerase/thioredoxin